MSAFALETNRLRLRDRGHDDLPFLASLYADPRVMRWIGDGSTYGYGEVEARYALLDAGTPEREPWNAFKIVERKGDGARLGHAGLLRAEIDGAPAVEIGWWLAPFAWGHGYATEAAIALRDHAFGMLALPQLSVVLNAANGKSVAVAERIGAAYAGEALYRGRFVAHYIVRPDATRATALRS